jgi:ATP synthase protein I
LAALAIAKSMASTPSASAEGGMLRNSILQQLSGRSTPPLFPSLGGIQPGETAANKAPVGTNVDPMADYRLMQRRLLLVTLGLTGLEVLVTAVFWDRQTILSVAIGGFAALLYLFLLTRSVEKVGGSSRQLGKVQLLVPVVLVLLSSRWHQLQLLPALIGFLVSKSAVIPSTVLDLRIGQRPQGSTPNSLNA